MNLGGPEILIVAALIVLVFGAGWLPKAAKNLGRAKVELDRTQKQLADTKQGVIEATGVDLDKANATLRKANRTLNSSPQQLLRSATAGAAAKAVKPTDAGSGGATETDGDATSSETDGAETDGVDVAAGSAEPQPLLDDTANITVDFSSDD